MISDSSNSTCGSSHVNSQENQEFPDLENLDNFPAEELLDDCEEKLCLWECEKANLEEKSGNSPWKQNGYLLQIIRCKQRC